MKEKEDNDTKVRFDGTVSWDAVRSQCTDRMLRSISSLSAGKS